ncbi:MAG: Anti-sigma-28 factor, FlgM [Rhizobacter sp.]|nr:Anti-sigma-28 factor, FlgM [Rhizobacter sp.]
MKIDSNTTRLLNNIAASAKAAAATTTTATAADSSASTPPTRVALSGASRISASGSGDFDAAKVDRIRTAIEAGTYQVDPEAIADGMISDARSFTSSGVF